LETEMTAYQSSYIAEPVLQDATFLLFTCSSADRYSRIAKSIADSSALNENLRSGAISVEDLVRRVRLLWATLLTKRTREVAEAEVAIILAVLGQTAANGASELLVELSLNDQAPVTWISALARQLYRDQAANVIGRIAAFSPNDKITGLADSGSYATDVVESAESRLRFEYGFAGRDFEDFEVLAA
jgi:hypothetical protein